MSTASAIAAANDIAPNFYEPGWQWWALPVGWVILLALGVLIAITLPGAVTLYQAGGWWAIPSAVLLVLAGLAAVVFAWIGPGMLMRHQPTGKGAFLVWLGCFAVAAVAWFVSHRVLVRKVDPYGYDYDSRRIINRVAMVPGAVIGIATLCGGVAELVTRLAASVPMGVVQFLGVVVGLVAIALIWVLSPRSN